MNVQDILGRYIEDADFQLLAKAAIQEKYGKFNIKGGAGSQFSFWISALFKSLKRPILVIMNDKEDGLYAHSDLSVLLPEAELYWYPTSYKKPYQLEDVDNANVVQRAEVLNNLNHSETHRPIIVTFAEALYEKVVNRRSLLKHTFEVKKGDTFGMDFLVDLLDEYGFEREEFVYEPGHFSIRGGILDVFSFASDIPYRIDFFGQEVESIKTFDVVSQMTDREIHRICLIPNIQTKIIKEERVSLLEYIHPDTLIFTRSIDFIQTELDRIFEKAQKYYDTLFNATGGSSLTVKPETIYLNKNQFLAEIQGLGVVEIGNKAFYPKHHYQLEWRGNAQPEFHKNFEWLCKFMDEQHKNDYINFFLSENDNQFIRLREIFHAFHHDELFTDVKGVVHHGFIDHQLKIILYTDHQIFDRYHKYKATSNAKKSQALTLKELRELKSGDYVTHINHGIGQFAGLHKVQIGEHLQEAIKVIFQGGDEVLVNVNALHKVSKYVGKDGDAPKLSKLGSGAWEKAKAKTKAKVKMLAFDLVNLYATRKAQPGFAFTPDSYLQQELEASFMYEDTPDQVKATEDIKADMENTHPMDRLICGDVGFGKTEVAIRAAFKAVTDSKQVAILVPTTILALQHFKTFVSRLKGFPANVDYINRFRSSKEIKETLQRVAEGKVDILIGTHRLVSKDVIFKNLGLLIIDEEQRFGVNVKDKLKMMKTTVDTLTLTATPIPRTLQFSLSGIRDLSTISTPPPNRQPIETILTTFDAVQVRDAISYELKRGGQVFFIHPRVKDILEVASGILKLVPDARIRIAHGQMHGDKLEEVMTDFIEGKFDILVSTTIVESGLDIPNANTILINEANKYGLSELHQMRGRVGRSNRKAFCYLIAPPEISLTTDAKKRLKAMEEFSDLGSGFHIAMKDLDIRGAGDLLGGEQSGFISEIGYEMYNRILSEAILELKEEHFSDLFQEEIKKRKAILVDDVHIDLDLDIKIPEMYIPGITERLNFYRKIAFSTKEEAFRTIQIELIDRFGPLPTPVLNLFDATRVREVAKRCGIEKITLKGKSLRLYFVADQNSPFYQTEIPAKVIKYLELYSGKIQMKQTPKGTYLIKEEVASIKQILFSIEELRDFVLTNP